MHSRTLRMSLQGAGPSHSTDGASANPSICPQCYPVLVYITLMCLINSLGPKFSSPGHFHSLQLLNVPQFLFSRLVRLKTAPRGNFSHA